jgi:1-acyl-sn-glycerol-3-phosphate acyltransferase
MKKLLFKVWSKISYAVWWLCHEWIYDLGWFVAPVVAFIVSDLEVHGREKIPKRGGVLLTMNHLSQWDLIFMHCIMGRPSFFMTKAEFFDFFFVGGLVRLLGAYPVKRGKYNRQALQYSIKLLKEGKQVILFPEGHRAPTFQLQEGHAGAALIAKQADALIVPIAITGSEKISRNKQYGPNGRKIRPKVVMQVGEPYHLPGANDKTHRQSSEELRDLMMGKIAEMLPPEYQGVYAPDQAFKRKSDQLQVQAEQVVRRAQRRAARNEVGS